MQELYFIKVAEVNVAEQGLEGVPFSRQIHHQRAVFAVGLVFDFNLGEINSIAALAWSGELNEGGESVGRSVFVSCSNISAGLTYRKSILSCTKVRVKLYFDTLALGKADAVNSLHK